MATPAADNEVDESGVGGVKYVGSPMPVPAAGAGNGGAGSARKLPCETKHVKKNYAPQLPTHHKPASPQTSTSTVAVASTLSTAINQLPPHHPLP